MTTRWFLFVAYGLAGGSRSPAIRNPSVCSCVFGSREAREAHRMLPASDCQLPPRTTRASPDCGPAGSSTSSAGYGPYQSLVHSATLPCMSCSPHAFAGNPPLRVGRCRNWPGGALAYDSLPLKLACPVVIVSPVQNAVTVPARQAYSHSDSVGRR